MHACSAGGNAKHCMYVVGFFKKLQLIFDEASPVEKTSSEPLLVVFNGIAYSCKAVVADGALFILKTESTGVCY